MQPMQLRAQPAVVVVAALTLMGVQPIGRPLRLTRRILGRGVAAGVPAKAKALVVTKRTERMLRLVQRRPQHVREHEQNGQQLTGQARHRGGGE